MRRIFQLLLPSLLAGTLYGQPPSASIGARFHHGSFFTSQTRALHIKDSYTDLFELNYTVQTNGSRDWHRANGHPRTGLALLYGNSGSRQHIGHIGGALAFVDWSLFRHRSFRSSFRAGGGIGLVEKPYDEVTNHKNLLLGTRTNCLLQFSWLNDIRVLNGLHANLGLSFTHLSNGRSQLPNLGLNVPAITGGLRYGVASKAESSKGEARHAEGLKNWAFLVGTSLGVKQSPTVGSRRYLVNIVQLEADRKFAPFANYGAGLMLSYDRSTASRFPDTLLPYKETIQKKFNAGVYLHYEQLLGRLTIPVQVGAYLLEPAYGSAIYQTFGVRYRFYRTWEASVQLKTHAGSADYIHYGINYRF